MQTRDEVEGLHNRREFSQRLECLYQARDLGSGVATRKEGFLTPSPRAFYASVICTLPSQSLEQATSKAIVS